MSDAQKIVDSLLEYALMPSGSGGFRFHEFKWMANMGGYNYPVDVHYGETYLGVAEVQQAHVEIYGIKLSGMASLLPIRKDANNKFKTLQLAAEAMLRFYESKGGGKAAPEAPPSREQRPPESE